jgi:hypothetical protein
MGQRRFKRILVDLKKAANGQPVGCIKKADD